MEYTQREIDAIAWAAYTSSGSPDAEAARVLLDLLGRALALVDDALLLDLVRRIVDERENQCKTK